jgi:hypothetical protein
MRLADFQAFQSATLNSPSAAVPKTPAAKSATPVPIAASLADVLRLADAAIGTVGRTVDALRVALKRDGAPAAARRALLVADGLAAHVQALLVLRRLFERLHSSATLYSAELATAAAPPPMGAAAPASMEQLARNDGAAPGTIWFLLLVTSGGGDEATPLVDALRRVAALPARPLPGDASRAATLPRMRIRGAAAR